MPLCTKMADFDMHVTEERPKWNTTEMDSFTAIRHAEPSDSAA